MISEAKRQYNKDYYDDVVRGGEPWKPMTDHQARLAQMCSRAKGRAKQKGVPHTLTKEEIWELWPEGGSCPIFETPMVFGTESGPKDNAPSLDRIVPKLGYVRDNCQIISNLANRIKSNATPEQVMAVALFLQEDI